MADQSNGYTLGFADGRRSMFHEIVTTVAEERHEPECSASTTFAGSVDYSCRFTPCF